MKITIEDSDFLDLNSQVDELHKRCREYKAEIQRLGTDPFIEIEATHYKHLMGLVSELVSMYDGEEIDEFDLVDTIREICQGKIVELPDFKSQKK